MKLEKTARESQSSNIPGEFKENYRFLCELISCEESNNRASMALQGLDDACIEELRNRLNRRQVKIARDFVRDCLDEDPETFPPPVPAELEASIRIRHRASWLPWEAEAIRKIERWRKDLSCIAAQLNGMTIQAVSDRRRSRTGRSGRTAD